jgi:hypothetical protein
VARIIDIRAGIRVDGRDQRVGCVAQLDEQFGVEDMLLDAVTILHIHPALALGQAMLGLALLRHLQEQQQGQLGRIGDS